MGKTSKSFWTKLLHFYFGDPKEYQEGYYNPAGFPTHRRSWFRIVGGMFAIVLTIAIPLFIWNTLKLLWIQDRLDVFWRHLWG